jgi:hypothetical protein
MSANPLALLYASRSSASLPVGPENDDDVDARDDDDGGGGGGSGGPDHAGERRGGPVDPFDFNDVHEGNWENPREADETPGGGQQQQNRKKQQQKQQQQQQQHFGSGGRATNTKPSTTSTTAAHRGGKTSTSLPSATSSSSGGGGGGRSRTRSVSTSAASWSSSSSSRLHQGKQPPSSAVGGAKMGLSSAAATAGGAQKQKAQTPQQVAHSTYEVPKAAQINFEEGPLFASVRFSEDRLTKADLLELRDFQTQRKRRITEAVASRSKISWKELCSYVRANGKRCGEPRYAPCGLCQRSLCRAHHRTVCSHRYQREKLEEELVEEEYRQQSVAKNNHQLAPRRILPAQQIDSKVQALARPKNAPASSSADTDTAAAAATATATSAAAAAGRTASPPRLAAERAAENIRKQRAKTAKPG